MSLTTADEAARRWSLTLIQNEMRRSGLTFTKARARVANRVQASPGTLENLHRNRLKGVRSWLYQNLLSVILADTEREIAALMHEHSKLKALGQRDMGGALGEVETSLARLRAALKGDGEMRL